MQVIKVTFYGLLLGALFGFAAFVVKHSPVLSYNGFAEEAHFAAQALLAHFGFPKGA